MTLTININPKAVWDDGSPITVADYKCSFDAIMNTPGSISTFFVPGNMVIVEHAGPVYSVYAHLQPGKMRVKPGAKIKQGAVIGACGNSGNTSEPHLHVQLQDAAALESAWGVNGIFAGVTVTRGGQTTKVEKYAFTKGDLVETAAR
jgi:murein DD-endopeptidase MepM/ murein hydrolase activator NlpD